MWQRCPLRTIARPYDRLDRADQNVRLRLDSTCVDVRHTKDRVSVGYVRGGALHRVEARHVVLACFHMMIPHIMAELPERLAALR